MFKESVSLALYYTTGVLCLIKKKKKKSTFLVLFMSEALAWHSLLLLV